MIKKLLKLNKPIGLTPLQLIKKYKKQHPEYQNIKMTYAGRLDPMAKGLMLILTGEECKNKQNYLDLEKEYIIDILFGVSTDTYDILGLIDNYSKNSNNPKINYSHYIGTFNQPYPPYSAKTVDGIPLWELSIKNKLPKIIPTKKVHINKIQLIKQYTINNKFLKKEIINRINNVTGDFRQRKIIKKWQEYFKQNIYNQYFVHKIKVYCSSGTYMRSLAYKIGKDINTEAIAFKINRIRIDKYHLNK